MAHVNVPVVEFHRIDVPGIRFCVDFPGCGGNPLGSRVQLAINILLNDPNNLGAAKGAEIVSASIYGVHPDPLDPVPLPNPIWPLTILMPMLYLHTDTQVVFLDTSVLRHLPPHAELNSISYDVRICYAKTTLTQFPVIPFPNE